jgi:hypothetical protein
MRHFASPAFWERYERLPAAVQSLADKSFALLKTDLRHPSLRVKKVGRYWAARVGIGYRALAVDVGDGLLWFWIGTHAEYDTLIKSRA